MSVDAVSILPYMQACRLMMVRLQTSYRSRLPSLRRQCLVRRERETPEVSRSFSHILSLVFNHRLLAFDSAYRCTIPLTTQTERKKNKQQQGHTRALVLGRSKSATNRSQSAFRSDGARGTWTENDRSRYASLFPGNVAHDNKRA